MSKPQNQVQGHLLVASTSLGSAQLNDVPPRSLVSCHTNLARKCAELEGVDGFIITLGRRIDTHNHAESAFSREEILE